MSVEIAMQTSKPTRRQFLKQGSSAIAGLSSFPLIIPRQAIGAPDIPPASDRLRIGHIGVGNQGRNNLKGLIRDTVAVCDLDKSRLADAQAEVEKVTGRSCAAYSDYRRLLDSKDVDAVVITTPDHWHALPTIHACEAGKDVYCEKPLTLTIDEGKVMVAAARRHQRIVQTGSQQRSDDKFRRACELVRSGRIGKVHTIKVGISKNNFKGPPVPDTEPPTEFDYDFWLGPAPARPYNPKRVHYNFRFFWDYSGGQLTNWGAHHLDIVQWALDMDHSGPVAIQGEARYHKESWYEVPEWCEVRFEYANGIKVHCGQSYRQGVTFIGDHGTIFVTRGKLTSEPAEIVHELSSDLPVRLYESPDHFRNWLDCIRSRELPICDVSVGHRSASVCHLGNIAILACRKIAWDPITESIIGDPEAAERMRRAYRAPWQLSKG